MPYYGTTASSAANTVWHEWTNSGTATSAATNSSTTNSSTVWIEWNSGTLRATTVRHTSAPAVQQLSTEEIERQRLAALQHAEERQQRWEKEAAERKAADERAKQLLLELLSSEQQAEYREDSAFHVIAEDGTRYRVKEGWSGNVEELDAEGQPVARFCIHPREQVPIADNMALQKMLLETDVVRFRSVANKTDIPRRRQAAMA